MNKIYLLIVSLLFVSGCGDNNVVKRCIYFKLPLKQPEYHWIFNDRASFIEHTTLKLDVFENNKMNTTKYSFAIIENGKMSTDWTPLDDDDNKEENRLYFGFSSNEQFDFSNLNYAKLTLKTSITMEGIGSENTGNLPKGSYTSFGRFSIYDEELYDAGTDECVFLDKKDLSPNWELVITGDEGYITVGEEKANQEKLIPLFIPALAAILTAAEKEKGSPLTKQEVLSIRDNSQTIMTPKKIVDKLTKSRGYEDIDPENCWNEWLLLRQKSGQKVVKNGGAIVLDSPSNNQNMRKAEIQARESLDQFRALIDEHSAVNPMIKVKLEESSTSARMWLIVDKAQKNSFKAHLFEVPSDFIEYEAGDSFTVKNDDVLDWMFNIKGDVYGAYTIREQRRSMTEQKRIEMDEYMGIKNYK